MITDYLSEMVADRRVKIQSSELNDLKKKEEENTTGRILQLIANYNACKVLISEQEFKLQELQLQYDDLLIDFKQQYMGDGFKATEAKELAKQDLKHEQKTIMTYEKDIAILKANIHNIEYQLRLKYLQFKHELLLEGNDALREM